LFDRYDLPRPYDGAGRATKRYVGYDLNETTYAEAETVTGDTILQQDQTTYDAASNVIQTTSWHPSCSIMSAA
jgi:hypothetical protein